MHSILAKRDVVGKKKGNSDPDKQRHIRQSQRSRGDV